MSGIPGTPREFERWAKPLSLGWPLELQHRAERALLSLNSMKQPAFGQSLAMQCGAANDLAAFVAAYDAHQVSCSTSDLRKLHGRSAPCQESAGTSYAAAGDEP